jgi:hypothetical protein
MLKFSYYFYQKLRLQIQFQVNLRPTVSRPVFIGVGNQRGPHDQILVFCLMITGFLMWGALFDERMGL